MAYQKPNHTQTPNELFDNHMKDMPGSELKVVMAVCRKTFGWHKDRDRISISQLEEMTGLSRPAVIAGTTKAIERGVLSRREVQGGYEYGLVLTGSKEILLSDQNKSLLPSKGPASNKSLHTKERVKERQTTKEKQKKNIYIQNNKLKKLYIQKIGKLTPSKIKRFQNWETLYSDKWILEAMDLAVEYNKKSFGYVQAILENWKENGRNGTKPTPENVDYLEDEFAEFIEE